MDTYRAKVLKRFASRTWPCPIRRINGHIADNFDTYYHNKIALPYIETVGVGSRARQVTCTTREELLEFLRSEDSLCAYSNYQELLAICNMLNISIHVFTYGIGGDESSWSWKTIRPDQELAKFSDFPPGAVPDMYLYNSDNCHYDLLVDENSRLAILGLIDIGEEDVKVVEGGVEKTEEPRDGVMDKPKKEEERNEQWKTVKGSKNLNKPHSPVKQHKVTADSDEVVLTKQKSNGHNRASPQSEPISQKDHTSIVNLGQICDICSHVTDNTYDLEAHMDTHKKCQKGVSCNQCEESFQDNSDLKIRKANNGIAMIVISKLQQGKFY